MIRRFHAKGIARLSQKRCFSHFENYSKISQVYDIRRRPVGLDKLQTALLAMHYDPQYDPVTSYSTSSNRLNQSFSEFLSDLRVLDAGCGTGNYITPLQDMGVGSIVGLEFNEGMLSKCRSKVQARTGAKLELHRGSVLEIPFKSGSFDFVMNNLVLHHVDDDAALNDDFANTRQAIGELYRQLHGPGSTLWITTSLLPGMLEVCWEYAFVPSCLEIAK